MRREGDVGPLQHPSPPRRKSLQPQPARHGSQHGTAAQAQLRPSPHWIRRNCSEVTPSSKWLEPISSAARPGWVTPRPSMPMCASMPP